LDTPVPWLAMIPSTNDQSFTSAQIGICTGRWKPVEEALDERGGHRMLRDDDILPGDEYYHVPRSTSNAPEHYKYPIHASLHTGSSQMTSAAVMARARIYCCGNTSRTIACVPATHLLKTRSCRAVEVVSVPDIVSALNRPMFFHGARWTGFEETTFRDGEDLPNGALFRTSQA
jgi:hypothetical protein